MEQTCVENMSIICPDGDIKSAILYISLQFGRTVYTGKIN